MAFSSGVKLGDLDDFISLSQECVKPLIQAAEGGNARLDAGAAETRATAAVQAVPEVPLVQRPNLIKSKQSGSDPKAQIGQVTLSDCLACSGCVTSAETVLLQEQSGEEFLRRASTAPVTVVSISAEARTSIAAHCGASPLWTLRRLAAVLHRLGAAFVLEGSAAEAIALLEGKAEFVQRFQGACGDRAAGPQLPLLTSHCPGWTCYAEKVVDPAVIPHLSPLKPPQQVQGRLVKTCFLEAYNRRRFYRWWRVRSPLFAAECGMWLRRIAASGGDREGCRPLAPGDVYHVSVQPCFDRKIEAARPHFEAPGGDGVREVDTVLTATELLELVRGAAGGAVPEAPADAAAADVLAAVPTCSVDDEVLVDLLLRTLAAGRPQPLLCAVSGNAGSGGFIEHVFREAARELFQIEAAPRLELKTRQNEDMREVLLEDPASKRVLLRFVAAHGFRNIQNVIRRLTKPSGHPDCGHFIEIMACPGGCLNGGGQIPAPKGERGAKQARSERRERLDGLEALLCSGEGTACVPPTEHPLVLPLYRYIASRAGGGAAASAAATAEEPLDRLIGGAAVRSWLSAEWRSLKVDSEGKAVIGTSALKW